MPFVCATCKTVDTPDTDIQSLSAMRAGYLHTCEECYEKMLELEEPLACEACEWIDLAPNNSYYSEPAWARCEIEHTCE
jgi:hypothetical protein